MQAQAIEHVQDRAPAVVTPSPQALFSVLPSVVGTTYVPTFVPHCAVLPSSPPQVNYSNFHSNPEFSVQHHDIQMRRESTIDKEQADATRGRFGPPEISPSEIVYDEELDFIGEGVFGRVFKGTCRQCSVAVKVPRNQQLTATELNDLRREVAIMSQIFHPNVVLFMGASTIPGSIKIVTEKMVTDVEKFLRTTKAQQMAPFMRFNMALDAAKGMSWLHGIHNLIHRDLKPANLLVDANHNVKVTDFGFSQILYGTTTRDMYGPRGTAIWMAPEVMKQEEFDKTIDVYSFGIILWQMFTLKEPFENYNMWNEFYDAVVTRKERPEIPEDAPETLRELIESCWSHDRLKRPHFPAIIYKLNEVLVDLVIGCPAGAAFWKKNFLEPHNDLEDIIRWPAFIKVLKEETGISDESKFNVLYNYLAVFGSDRRVTIHSFAHTIQWFGYFFVAEKAEECLQKAQAITQEGWFHGGIDQLEAEGRLRLHPPGTFLVRLSRTKVEYPFTLSLTQCHLRIRKEIGATGEEVFTIQEHSFPSLHSLVENIREILHLTGPCPRGPAPSAYNVT
eukprot:TRINITY_DN7069_c0_g1_i1.p1 TRINITY_DN7069_c0_g1~~TRINITY_DN7069_c0_g1_i1.p1  ORF type:complete len:562 (+),score=85.34 TRINITY_DN7069_c0_g1_i1:30-1715(+)